MSVLRHPGLAMAEGDEGILSMQEDLKQLALDANLFKFCRLLAFIDSPVVQESLFIRSTRTRVIWTESGELGYVPPGHSKVPHWLVQLFDTATSSHENPMLQQAVRMGILSMPRRDEFQSNFFLEEKWRNALRAGLPLASSLEYLFDVLAVVIHSFPESYAELLWGDTEEQLWDVIESTVLPLLAVSNVRDILAHSPAVDVSGQRNYLQLHRDLFEEFLKVSCNPTPTPQDVLPHILFYAPAAVQRSNLLHLQNNERLNAAQILNRDHSSEDIQEDIAKVLSWTPISRGKPSTMETVALASFHGASNVLEMFRVFLYSIPSQVVALLGFIAAKQQSFEAAREILELSIIEVKELFGVVSNEYLITGIELVKCYNFLMEENEGEDLARKLSSEVFGSKSGSMNITSLYRANLAIVLSDSLIGQAKYDDAEDILLAIIGYQGLSSDLFVSASLRLLKMSRRQRKECPSFDTWQMLEMAVGCIDYVSDDLKYECVEEAMCHISVLDEDPAQIPRAEAVVTALSRISTRHFLGSETSKQNIMRHMCALRQYRIGFKLFSVTGPQLHFSRLIRDGFPSASISFIERIGTANWNRFNRVKELPLRAEIIMDEACHTDGRTIAGMSEGTFTDSALGSSLQTASKRARTQVSYQSVGSAIGGSIENFPPMPVPSSKGKPFECPICCKRLRGVVSTAQWEHHVYADLQPYVCILDKCSSRITTFGSRLEFTNHMSEHQHVVVWSCKACQYTQNDSAAIEEHIAKSHPDLDVQLTVISSSIRRNMAEEQCPFCGVIPGSRFIGHICRHFEEVALSILPKEVEWDSGSEDVESDSDRSDAFCGLCETYGHDTMTCSNLSFREKTYLVETSKVATGQRVPLHFDPLKAEDINKTLQSSHSISELGNFDQDSLSVSGSPSLATPILSSAQPPSNSNFLVPSPTLPPSPIPMPSLPGVRLPTNQPNLPSFGFFDSEQSPQDSPPDRSYDWDKYFPIMADLYYNQGWSVRSIHQRIQDPATRFTPSLQDIWSKFSEEARFPRLEDDLVNSLTASSPWAASLYPQIPGVDFNTLENRQYYHDMIAFRRDPNLSSRRFSLTLPLSTSSAIRDIALYLGLEYQSLMGREAESYVEISKPQFNVTPNSGSNDMTALQRQGGYFSVQDSRHLHKSGMKTPGRHTQDDSRGDDPPLGHSRMTPTGQVSSSHQPYYLHPQFAERNSLNDRAIVGDFTPMYQGPSSSLPSKVAKQPDNRFSRRIETSNECNNPEPEMPSNTQTAVGQGFGAAVGEWVSNEDYMDRRLGPDGSPTYVVHRFPAVQTVQDSIDQLESNRQPSSLQPNNFRSYVPRMYSGQASSSRNEAPSTEQMEGGQSSPVNQQPAFQLPRKNAAITIKRPDGTPLDISYKRVSTVPKFVKDNPSKSTNPKYCGECDITFRKAHKWIKHMQNHRVQSMCRVPGCGRFFFEVQDRIDHEVQHVTCTVEGCGKQFVDVKERRKHYRTHAAEETGETGGPSTE
ncbi:hypothetical protein IFR05_001145 [Cadophora sp. M221]|nr:hypothetical protein IFR05_001145 [Cadophora sp. M221]